MYTSAEWAPTSDKRQAASSHGMQTTDLDSGLDSGSDSEAEAGQRARLELGREDPARGEPSWRLEAGGAPGL